MPGQFQSTPPARGATAPVDLSIAKAGISIHAPREGGDLQATLNLYKQHQISIHAPREGGDIRDTSPIADQRISIHAPREGGDWLN